MSRTHEAMFSEATKIRDAERLVEPRGPRRWRRRSGSHPTGAASTERIPLADLLASSATLSLRDVLEGYPTLCSIGFGASNVTPRATLAEHLRSLEAARAELVAHREEIDLACAYLAHCSPTRTALMHSYGLKHRAEKWNYGAEDRSYVANGALIAAALMLGYTIRPCERASLTLAALGRSDPNAYIGVSRRSVDRLTTET